MNQREAKAEAYRIASAAVEGAIGTDLIDPDLEEADAGRLEDALNAIASSLLARGEQMRYRRRI